MVAKGLCQKHYLRVKRGSTRDRPGPARRYARQDEGKRYRGAPRIEVRLEPDAMAWVKARGGIPWVRRILERLHQLREDPAVGEVLARLEGEAGAGG